MASHSRPRPAFRADLRFLVGIALVVISIAGVWLLVAASDRTEPLLQARRTIARGEVLTADDFEVAQVSIGALTDRYVGPGRLAPGQIARRTLTKGELLPRSAVADEKDDRTTTVVIETTTAIPDSIGPGADVEVWQAPARDDGRTFDAPRVLVGDAVVRTVLEDDGMLAESGTKVEIVVDRTDVADVLAAATGGAALSVIPVGAGS